MRHKNERLLATQKNERLLVNLKRMRHKNECLLATQKKRTPSCEQTLYDSKQARRHPRLLLTDDQPQRLLSPKKRPQTTRASSCSPRSSPLWYSKKVSYQSVRKVCRKVGNDTASTLDTFNRLFESRFLRQVRACADYFSDHCQGGRRVSGDNKQVPSTDLRTYLLRRITGVWLQQHYEGGRPFDELRHSPIQRTYALTF
ncbi:unnamed protein product [Acanthosepion pharaonis]|uniref:Uncharacterized protein n=1 Tax=Acanthosepion pharaonis TaxID=158019 RepID=A0A812CWW8_ACAPH|nr:unnamed protein product [Sepia pharaonis]